MARHVYIETFGCQMNEVDSARMLALLGEMDYHPAESLSDADLVLLNTCSIREKADQKIFSALGRLRGWKRGREGRIVAVGGCLAQQKGSALRERAPHVDIVFGTHSISRLPELVRIAEGEGAAVSTDLSDDTSHWDVLPYLADGAASAMVTIMQGCDNYCAYCIVPYVRGREISRPSAEVLDEVRELACRGVCEVVLLGQNVNSYGKKEGGIPFPALLKRISRIPGIRRIRFITSHPRDLDRETIDLFSEIDSLCPHIHLPIQSGSDGILSSMERGYTRSEYLRKVENLRMARPGIAFSSDFIVGFPGETESDFRDTLAVMEEVRFDSSFSFRFSPRPGTKAAGMAGTVAREEAGRRLVRLQALQDRHTRERLEACVGKEMEVLVEGKSAKDPTRLCGRTPCHKTVNFSPVTAKQGCMHRVRIRSAGPHSLSGEEGGPCG
ncbi:MAG: tRNA (N6-isopentenyl adenosine(37)-C2)-methylthiotransferase MiaB [Deltaproteobacteria bacterium]|nr:MAG: tRNA (N6-isopentenyl adenosine(37)-C2)-methylthiotransferase MiaB [Deltaproteobacteria bacterium]